VVNCFATIWGLLRGSGVTSVPSLTFFVLTAAAPSSTQGSSIGTPGYGNVTWSQRKKPPHPLSSAATAISTTAWAGHEFIRDNPKRKKDTKHNPDEA
jgi:hypothetical protein